MKSKFIIGIVLFISLLSFAECKLKHLQKQLESNETNDERNVDLLVEKLISSYKQLVKGGEFTKDDPHWIRDDDDTDVPYDLYYLDVTKKGTFILQNSDGDTCDMDSYLYLYNGDVDVKDYEKNLIDYNDDGGVGGCSYIEQTLEKGSYTVVQTLYDDDDEDYLPYVMMAESNDGGEAYFGNGCHLLKPSKDPKVFGNFQQCLFPPKDEMECFDIKNWFDVSKGFNNYKIKARECSALKDDKFFKRTCKTIANPKSDQQYTYDEAKNQICVKRQACMSAGKQDMCIRFYEITAIQNDFVRKNSCEANSYTIMVPGNAQSIDFRTRYCH